MRKTVKLTLYNHVLKCFFILTGTPSGGMDPLSFESMFIHINYYKVAQRACIHVYGNFRTTYKYYLAWLILRSS